MKHENDTDDHDQPNTRHKQTKGMQKPILRIHDMLKLWAVNGSA